MVNIVRPYLPPRGGIRFRDKKNLSSLQVTAVQTHVVDGQKKVPRLTATVKLGEWHNQETFDEAFTKAYDEAKRKKVAMDVEVSSKSIATLRHTKVRQVGTFGQALEDLWNKRYVKQEQSNMAKVLINDVLNYFPKEKKLNSFTIAEIDAFKEHLKNLISSRTHCSSGTVSNNSINHRLGIIREVFRHAIKHRWMGTDDVPNPDNRVKNMGVEDLPRSATAIKPVLDVQQESAIIQQARDNGDEAYSDALIFLFDTGMRHDGEINRVTYDMVDFKNKSISFQRNKTGGNWSTIPLTSRCLQVAKRRSKFALANGGRMWTYTRGQLRHKWDLSRKMAGLPKKFTSYCTRHTCCTRLVESGLPANVVKDWMGHASIVTSLTYYAKSSKKLMNQAVSALETYNQDCDATKGDVIPMMGHNSKNKVE